MSAIPGVYTDAQVIQWLDQSKSLVSHLVNEAGSTSITAESLNSIWMRIEIVYSVVKHLERRIGECVGRANQDCERCAQWQAGCARPAYLARLGEIGAQLALLVTTLESRRKLMN